MINETNMALREEDEQLNARMDNAKSQEMRNEHLDGTVWVSHQALVPERPAGPRPNITSLRQMATVMTSPKKGRSMPIHTTKGNSSESGGPKLTPPTNSTTGAAVPVLPFLQELPVLAAGATIAAGIADVAANATISAPPPFPAEVIRYDTCRSAVIFKGFLKHEGIKLRYPSVFYRLLSHLEGVVDHAFTRHFTSLGWKRTGMCPVNIELLLSRVPAVRLLKAEEAAALKEHWPYVM